MLGRVAYPGMFFQMDAPTGRYEDAPLGLGWQGPSLDYRKLEKLELDPRFRAWLENPLFERIARAVIPGDIVLYRAILFHKGQAGGSNLPWHQDGGRLWGLTQEPELQIWTALDDAPEDGGCLEVVPGSHRGGLVTPLGGVIPPDRVAEADAEARRVLLPAQAGEVMLLHNHVWHRSGPSRTGQRRRAFSTCYMSAHDEVRAEEEGPARLPARLPPRIEVRPAPRAQERSGPGGRRHGHSQLWPPDSEPSEGFARSARNACAEGKMIRNVVPRPTSLSTASSPPKRVMMLWHTNSPSPVPTPTGLVVKNGSKMRERISGGIPAPVSLTSTITWSCTERSFTRISLRSGCPAGMACAALISRLRNTCPKRPSLPSTGGTSA